MVHTSIIYYTTSKRENPVSDFLDSLSQKQQAKVLRIIQTIKKYGVLSVLPHLKKLIGTPLWEIRILGKDNIRVIYLVENENLIVLLHGFIKKTQKTSQKDLSIAINRYSVWNKRTVK